MKHAQIAELKTHLSRYLARVRTGETVVVYDRKTPIAQLVPYAAPEERLVVHGPERAVSTLRRIRGIKVRRSVDLVALLRESRDQR